MSAALLATKFYSPQLRGNLIPRPRLEKKLSESLPRRLALISAPPGFGKTTLVAAWLSGLQTALDGAHPQTSTPAAESAVAAWLLLDEGDNDLARFFAYLVAALQRIEPDLGKGVQAQLEAPQLPPLEALVAILINDLSYSGRDHFLVLDDYHLIRNETVHQATRYLIQQQPRNLHLVLLTREDPPLHLHSLRARDEIIEVREQDLRFSIQEAADFLNLTMALNLSPEAIVTLTNRTEGWIAGLQMAAIALQSQLSLQSHMDTDDFIASFRGDDRYIIDYLTEEVIRRQSLEIQDFLLRTSILNKLCAGLCDEVLLEEDSSLLASADPSPIPDRSSQEILEYLDRSNLFLISLDNRREWYRYHRLFADLLRYRLLRQFPEQLPQLHRRACQWWRRAGDVEEAMKHAFAIPDHDLAAELAEGYLQYMIRASRIGSCLNWIQKLPDEVVRPRAYLNASCAWVYMLKGDFETAGGYLEASQAALESYEPVYSPSEERWITREEVQGHLSAIRAFGARWQNDFPRAIVLSQQALRELPATATEIRCVVALNLGIIYMAIWEPEMAWNTQLEAYELAMGSRENRYVAVTALCQLAGIAVWRGKLREAERRCHEAIQLGTVQAGKPVSLPAVAYAHGWLAAVYNQRYEADAAQSQVEKALELVELVGPLATDIYARLFHARLALDAGDFSKAESLLEWAEEKSRAYPMSGLVKTEWVVNRGRFYLESGEVPAAVHWLSSQGVEAQDLPEAAYLDAARPGDDLLRSMRTRLPEYLLLARALLAQGERARAEDLLDRICAAAEAWQYEESLLEALVLRAAAAATASPSLISPQMAGGGAWRGGRFHADQGLSYLERALELAAPEGYVRPFLIAGDPIVKLLRQAIIHGIQPVYARNLLAHLAEKQRSEVGRVNAIQVVGLANAGTTGLVEPLTDREKQVLRLLAAGLTSTEVAEELVISVNTTRSYIKSIYGKLDAHSRDEAVEKGTQLGLV